MKPSVFDYVRVTSVDEAIQKLAELGSDGKVLAGGQSLIPMMKLRLARPAVMIDINSISALNYVREEEGFVRVGATRRQYQLESPSFSAQCPLLGEALPHVGHEATRNRGTLCGSLAHADPMAEAPIIACCLDAEIVALSSQGERTIPARDFFVSFFTSALEPNELVIEVKLPTPEPNSGFSFHEFGVRHAKFGLVAVSLSRDDGGKITRLGIAIGAVADIPVRALEAEAMLEGQTGGEEIFREAADMATAKLDPHSDVHGTGEFRKEIAQTLLVRALNQAWHRSQRGNRSAEPQDRCP